MKAIDVYNHFQEHGRGPWAANDNLPIAASAGKGQGLRVLDLFSAAAGGWSLGMHRAGFRTMAACEVVDWRRALYSENNPGVPVYDDVTTLTADRLIRDGHGLPDIIVGSPPCQDISSANTKGKGVDGERSGLYFEAIRLIGECRPRWFALENSANLRTRGADRVIDALAAIGYTCWPFVVSAGDVGANHERKRSWLIGFRIADADSDELRQQSRWSGWESRASASVSECATGHASQDGCGQGRARGYPVATEGLPVEACGDAPNAECSRYQGGFRKPAWTNTVIAAADFSCERVAGSGDAQGSDNVADADAQGVGFESWPRGNQGDERQNDGCVVGNDNGHGREGQQGGQMGGSSRPCAPLAEPWADWNGGLAHHLRVDDGLSAWVAQSRIAVGGPKGTVAASLIVEAFGDAVCPQIPEAIGRAILRVERALYAVAANTTEETAIAAA
ncbi:DNA-cytosine methyltransferase protein [Rhizobium phage RHph_X2_25]|nr:DNA-cytosine methyltransferase protein [Rhizobium phage RHph_X2_25]